MSIQPYYIEVILKVLGALVVLIIGLSVYAWITLGGSDNSSDQGNNVKKDNTKVETWDGKGEHLYKMEIPDSTGSLFIDRASFTGLRSSRTTAIIRMSYQGEGLPAWLQGKKASKNFKAFYQGSDDRVTYRLSQGPLQDGVSVIDFVMRNVPSVRLDPLARKGLFISINGILPRSETFYLRVSAKPEPGYKLGPG